MGRRLFTILICQERTHLSGSTEPELDVHGISKAPRGLRDKSWASFLCSSGPTGLSPRGDRPCSWKRRWVPGPNAVIKKKGQKILGFPGSK